MVDVRIDPYVSIRPEDLLLFNKSQSGTGALKVWVASGDMRTRKDTIKETKKILKYIKLKN